MVISIYQIIRIAGSRANGREAIMKLIKGKVPLYHQLEGGLRRKIIKLKILEDDGLIKREQGRGTFVNEKDRNLSFYEMSSSLERAIGFRETFKIELTSKQMVQAHDDIAADLGVEAGTEVWLLEGRQELNNDLKQAQFLQVYARRGIGETIPLGEMEGRSFFPVLEIAAMETAVQFNQILYATGADEKMAQVIHVPAGSPLLVNRNVFLSKKGKVLGIIIRYSPGEVHRIIHKMKMRKARL
jgi:DNA-binding GntR family transcriptional regulator